MIRFSLLLLLLSACASLPVQAQQEGLLQLNDAVHDFLLRQQVQGRLPDAFLTHQPLSAYEAQRYLDSLALHDAALSSIDRRLLARFRGTAPGPGARTVQRLLPFAYTNGRNFFSVRHKDYGFEIDPLAYLYYGRAQQTEREGREASVPVWQNTRGIRAAGHIGKYAFFETRLEENQRRTVWPTYEARTAPRQGHTKFDASKQTYDYFIATGMIGLRSKYFEARLGRDRNRWGYGKGSLLLSNYPTVYDQLQLRTTVWRFQYTNLYVARTQQNNRTSGRFSPRLYGVFHRLEVALPARLRLEFFEAIMFASDDSTGLRDSGFDLAYLNPIIFLRAVEADRGSPDNALLGAGISWIAVPGVRLHTNLLLDELRVSEIGKEWWANKWGWLVGAHIAGFPLDNLSLRLEYARMRPYLYAHDNTSSAYLHHADPLGHPAGPNAIDWLIDLSYQPLERLHIAGTLAYTRRGRDTPDESYGSDPARSTDERVRDRGVVILQGIRQTALLAEGSVGYELLPSLWIHAALRAESIDDAETGTDRYLAPFVGLRWGLPFQSVRY